MSTTDLPNYDAWLERPYQEAAEKGEAEEAAEEAGYESVEDYLEAAAEARAERIMEDRHLATLEGHPGGRDVW